MRTRILFTVAVISYATIAMAQTANWNLKVSGNIQATDSIIAPSLKISSCSHFVGPLQANYIATTAISISSGASVGGTFQADSISTSSLNIINGAHIGGALQANAISGSSMAIDNGVSVGGQLQTNSLRTNTIYPVGTYLTLNTNEVRVPGTIKAKEIIVNTTGADFVFDKDYMLRSLDEVRSYIEEHQHLPEIPSAVQMQEEGMSVDRMVVKLLQKVEELTLYTIQQEERIRELENKP